MSFNNQEMQTPKNIEELILRYDLDNLFKKNKLIELIDTEIEENKSLLSASPTTVGATIGSTDVVFLYLNNTVASVGNDLYLNDGVVVCAKNGYVRATASIMYYNGSINSGHYVGTRIYKNNDAQKINALPYTHQYINPTISGIIQVNAGDVLKLGALCSTADVTVQPWSAVTYLDVEYI